MLLSLFGKEKLERMRKEYSETNKSKINERASKIPKRPGSPKPKNHPPRIRHRQ